MSLSNEHILIDYLDNRLEGAERLEAEQLLSEDATAARELANLRFSVDLIRESAVLEQVKEVRKSFGNSAKIVPFQKKERGAVVHSFSRSAMRIAAMLLLLVGAAGAYKYATTTSASVYNDNFVSYELATSRGADNDGAIEKAYRSKDWTAVKNLFLLQKEKTIKTWFLAGMSDLELKNYTSAIVYFKEVLNLNKKDTAAYYQDEAEYYLAMSYLGAQQPAEAITLLNKIRSDKNHLYYKKTLAISSLELKMLELRK